MEVPLLVRDHGSVLYALSRPVGSLPTTLDTPVLASDDIVHPDSVALQVPQTRSAGEQGPTRSAVL